MALRAPVAVAEAVVAQAVAIAALRRPEAAASATREALGKLRAETIRPLPSQERFLDAMYDHEYVLFGGAAGPGKSYILRWSLVELLLHWSSQGHHDVRVGLFCEDYPSLRDRQISRMRREFPDWLGELRGSQTDGFGFFMRPEYGGHVIALRNLDNPAKYASSEFAAVAVDELTKNVRQTFDDLRFRKRWPGIEHSPFLAGTNPGSLGHGWVKKLWVDRDFSGDDTRFNPDSFAFIPARIDEMLTLRPDLISQRYLDTLNSLPEAMRRAMLDGDWSVFAGQVFSEWRHNLHVVEPFPIPDDWTRWRCVDYGFSAPFCCLWIARSPDKRRLVVYRELYQAGLRASEQAKAIRLASGTEGRGRWITAADPSMWQRRQDATGLTLADEYNQHGVNLMRAHNERIAGWDAVHAALGWKEIGSTLVEPPRLQVFSSCRNLIRTLPELVYDNIRTEDVDSDMDDHAADALRYGLMAERRQDRTLQAGPQLGPVYSWR